MSNSRIDEDDEWEVEKILDKSVSRYGCILYLVKWKNFNEAGSSWEPLENLNCPNLIAEFEEQLEKQNQFEARAVPGKDVVNSQHEAEFANEAHQLAPAQTRKVAQVEESFSLSLSQEESLKRAEAKFEKGYVPDKIVGAINIRNSIKFLIKWRDRVECDLVRSKIARQKCPQLILDFYERNIRWV